MTTIKDRFYFYCLKLLIRCNLLGGQNLSNMGSMGKKGNEKCGLCVQRGLKLLVYKVHIHTQCGSD